MRDVNRFFAALALAFLSILVLFASPITNVSVNEKHDLRAEAQALLRQCNEMVNLTAPDGPPFRLHASVQATDELGQPIQGTYLLCWASLDRYRQEMNFPGYSAVSVADGHTIWKKRTLPYVPLFDWRTLTAIQSPQQALLAPIESVKSINRITQDGVELTCLQTEVLQWFERKVCLDVNAAVPVLTEDRQLGSRIEFSKFMLLGYHPFHRFPREIRYSLWGKLRVTIDVDQIDLLGKEDPAWLIPPSGARAWPMCGKYIHPEPLHPLSTHDDTLTHRPYDTTDSPMNITYYTRVDEHGTTLDFRLLDWHGNGLAAKGLQDQLGHMQYNPATCDGTPVEAEVVRTLTITKFAP